MAQKLKDPQANKKKGDRKLLTPELRADIKALAAMPEREIDTAEMPPISDWSHAVRGPFYRPSSALCHCVWMPTSLTGSNARDRAIRPE